MTFAVPRILAALHKDTRQFLATEVPPYLESCDDLLFSLAEKARNQSEQNLYFNSLRSLRLHRDRLTERVLERCREEFEQWAEKWTEEPPAAASPPADSHPKTSTPATLSLVTNTHLEQEIAITGVIKEAENRSRTALGALNQRLEALRPDASAASAHAPVQPAQIVMCIQWGLNQITLEDSARVLLLKHLGRTLTPALHKLYGQLNSRLIAAGVLPELEPPQLRVVKSAETQTLTDTKPQHSQATAAHTASLLQGIARLATTNQPGLLNTRHHTGPTLSVIRIIAAFNDYQHSHASLQLTAPVSLSRILAPLLESGAGEAASLQADVENTLNLVVMLFEFIHSDPAIPDAFQVLIARLQLPMAKLALRDDDLFRSPQHPARTLLNTLAEIAIGFNADEDLKQDPTFACAQRIVFEILESEATDRDLFQAMDERLQQYLQHHRRRIGVLESRLRQAVTGKAAHERAQAESGTLLQQQLQTAQLPAPVWAFLQKDWYRTLVFHRLRLQPDSAEWLRIRQVTDDLVWCLRSHANPRALTRLASIRQTLPQQVQAGLTALGYAPDNLASTLGMLEHFLDAAYQGTLDSTQLTPMPVTFAQLVPSHWADRGSVPVNERLAAQFEPGQWCLWTTADGTRKRCRLALISEPDGRRILVNRHGLKLAELTLAQTASEIANGKLVPLATGHLFERALQAIHQRIEMVAS